MKICQKSSILDFSLLPLLFLLGEGDCLSRDDGLKPWPYLTWCEPWWGSRLGSGIFVIFYWICLHCLHSMEIGCGDLFLPGLKLPLSLSQCYY